MDEIFSRSFLASGKCQISKRKSKKKTDLLVEQKRGFRTRQGGLEARKWAGEEEEKKKKRRKEEEKRRIGVGAGLDAAGGEGGTALGIVYRRLCRVYRIEKEEGKKRRGKEKKRERERDGERERRRKKEFNHFVLQHHWQVWQNQRQRHHTTRNTAEYPMQQPFTVRFWLMEQMDSTI